jgi:pSer/pThr/pTyr-binding forkhead associated (FHA) protein
MPLLVGAAAVAPIAPIPVVDVRSAQAAALQESTRVCARCRGTSEASAQFCKFCGASFAAEIRVVGLERAPKARPSSAPPPGPSAAPQPAPQGGGLPGQLSAPPTAPHMSVQPLPVAQPSPLAFPTPNPSGAAQRRGSAPPPPNATPLIPPSTETSQYQAALPMPAPAVPSGRLVVITKDGGEGASYPIYEQLDVGRLEGDVVVAEDRYLSPRHARILRRSAANGEPGGGSHGHTKGTAGLVLRDLGSVNGIFLRVGNAMGGDGRVEVVLADQDLFLVGQQVLKFEAVKDGEDGLGPASQHGTLLFGTPQAPRFARIAQRTVEGVTRDLFHIRKVETVLGRESGDIVFTDDPFLSRRHAVIKYDRDNKRFLLADLGSSNGTFVQIRGDVALKSGDQFRIGQQLYRVELLHVGAET